jgi:pimeloyl-ACP methyl ester carboxylesterase
VNPEPAPAAWNPIQKLRDAIRTTTVLLMKDRAGRVGGNGVAKMLRELADVSTSSRIHLVGHSYGAKVVLSALCVGQPPSRKINSILLLEPALSCFAFTYDLGGKPGGYRPALDRVRLPIITTRSAHDVPLTKFFHLAVRRKSDLAEGVIAADGPPPSLFAALGGYGPQGVGADRIDMPGVGDAYPLSTAKRIISVDGTSYIDDHGSVETPETAWALLSQVRA